MKGCLVTLLVFCALFYVIDNLFFRNKPIYLLGYGDGTTEKDRQITEQHKAGAAKVAEIERLSCFKGMTMGVDQAAELVTNLKGLGMGDESHGVRFDAENLISISADAVRELGKLHYSQFRIRLPVIDEETAQELTKLKVRNGMKILSTRKALSVVDKTVQEILKADPDIRYNGK